MRVSRKARREIGLILLFVSSVTLVSFLILGEQGYLKLPGYRQQLQNLHLENRSLRQQHLLYLDKIHRLKNDPLEIERVAREQYNFARPGDVILHLPD